MTRPADLVLTNAEVHTLATPDTVHGAVAVRDGRIVRVDSAYEVDFLVGTPTEVLDCGGRVLLPGFIDAHTHMEMAGRRIVHADLGDCDSRGEALSRLAGGAREEEWIQGYGYDETEWGEREYLTRGELDSVSDSRPVVAFREDMHTASLNSVALAELEGEFGGGVERSGGDPTGVVVEDAVGVVQEAITPSAAGTRGHLLAARDRAHELGITAVHDMVRGGHDARVYRELDRDGELDLRVRINYWTDHLDAVAEAGLVTNAGTEFVRVGAVKTFTDGSVGARTAKLSAPYEDDPGNDGEWVVTPEELREWLARAEKAGLQFTAHAIGDRAIAETLEAYAEREAGEARHRVEHAELLPDSLLERFASVGAVASVQPNFHRWAREGGLYESRLGVERTRETNRLGALLEAGVPLAFGSDTMPLGPLYGIEQAVTAPAPDQRLSVTESLRAYTQGGAYAGFDEDRMGTVEPGKVADLVVLDASPWEVPGDELSEVGAWATVVDGGVVYGGA
jgi:hypothetical protein